MKQNIRNLPFLRMALLILLSACAFCVRSQVTVGDGTPPHDFSVLEVSTAITRGGLRLPQLTTIERETWKVNFLSLPAEDRIDPQGLAIYNTDTKCYEYWNATRWVSLCEGNSLMTIGPDPCHNVDADGTGCDNEFTVTDPDCLNGPFTIVIVAGQDYASLTDVNETDGIFRIAFEPNNSVNLRSVVVRVTSSCTGLYKDFLFTQAGYDCDTSLGNAPAITAVPSNFKFCAGGAAYLSIDEAQLSGTGTLADVIWTRNNIEIARGVNNIVVTQEGKYNVWMGFVGCNAGTGSSVTITRDGTGAPSPVSILVNGNNGMVCGPTGTTTLVAINPNGGTTTVQWFKNGILQDGTNGTDNITGTQVTVGIGNWFAVVKDGTCYSRPSETVAVIENPNSGTTLIPPVLNPVPSFCAGSSVQLSVANVQSGYTYTWYENNTQIGIGSSVMYTVPSGAESVVIRCRATQAGSCAQEALSVETITTGTIPGRPEITGNTVLCSGSATLNVIPRGSVSVGATYAWYDKNNTLIGTSQQIIVTSGGDYYATVTDGCTSPMAHINIPAASSANPVVILTSSSATPGLANEGDEVTYNASITFGPALNYIWTINAALRVSGGQPGDTYAVVKYNTPGAASVKVEAFNACGTATATRNVTVSNICADPDPTTISPSGDVPVSAIAGSAFPLGPVSVNYTSGSPTTAYQWYRNTTKSYDGATLLVNMTFNTLVATELSTGTSYYFCKMTNAGCTTTSVNTGFYIVSAVSIPANAGTGNFTGKTCFDIAFSNFGGDCGTETARKSQRTDFDLTVEQDAGSSPVYTGKQVYTFTPSGNVSNVRFVYLDTSGQAIESMTAKADYSGNISSGVPCKAVVVYKASLNTTLRGKKRDVALKPELYVIYNDQSSGSGTDRAIKLTVSLQDCACCGAATTTGGWLNFMCHNLGANESLDPFTYVVGNTDGSGGTLGHLYQWGRPKDGHQLRNSGTTTTLATNNTATAPAAVVGKFITNNSSPYDWRSGGGNPTRWGDGSANYNMDKADNDPCDPGWKVPSQQQWASIIRGAASGTTPGSATANTWTWTNNGYKVGSSLYLPAAGGRRYGKGDLDAVGSAGYYWSSTFSSSTDAKLVRIESNLVRFNDYHRAHGFSVRCVSEN